jgi:nucleotide-binding universal stress UspA family protein
MTEHLAPSQVVVAYDFSPSAELALMRAVDVACRAPHHVLHICTALDKHSGLAVAPTDDVTVEYADRIRQLVVDHVTAAFAGRYVACEVQFFVHARIGKPADEILALAHEVGADLIFIGSHGKTGFERLLLGSTSERVVREAKCPVMVIRDVGYAPVDLLHMLAENPHSHPYTPPHRYSYTNAAVVTRPDEWPIS